jgi:predicted RNase H-like HicB family nuclease
MSPYSEREGQGSVPYQQVAWLRRGASARVAQSYRVRHVRNDSARTRRADIESGLLRRSERNLGALSWKRLVEEIVKTYHVTYERNESGWWVASVRGLRGCHTQGRTVDEARRRIVEAMELFVDSVRAAKIVDDVKLPAAARKAIRAYATLRRKAEQEDRRASVAARRAVRVLRGGRLKMSARDAARVLGLSHQRVHQLANGR